MTATITIHGGLTTAPELRFSSSGAAVCSGTIASTERYQKNGEWVDGKSLYVRWSAFRDLAENIAATGLDKGSQVVITGKLHTRDFEDRDGNKRSTNELEVTDFAVSLKRATAQITRKSLSNGGQSERTGGSAGGWSSGVNNAASSGNDGWATGGDFSGEAPF